MRLGQEGEALCSEVQPGAEGRQRKLGGKSNQGEEKILQGGRDPAASSELDSEPPHSPGGLRLQPSLGDAALC